MQKNKSTHPLHKLYRSFRARPRMVISALFGIVVFLLMPPDIGFTRAMLGWNSGVILFIVLILTMMARTDATKIRDRAIAEEEGRFTVLTLVIAAATMALIAIVVELLATKDLQATSRALRLALTFLTVIDSWAFVHVIFTIYYAHEYHTEIKGRGKNNSGGLMFPGEKFPDYFDFLYFALTIGMTAQTSDVVICSRRMRRVAIVHGIVSFVFTTAVISLTVNLGAQLLQ
jgi:uncharacterized membrane protein